MFKTLSIAVFGLLIALFLPQNARAETVVDKVSRTGVLTFGTRVDLIPYSVPRCQLCITSNESCCWRGHLKICVPVITFPQTVGKRNSRALY